MTDDLDDLAPPNCGVCLVALVIAGTDERPFWRCPECGLVRI